MGRRLCAPRGDYPADLGEEGAVFSCPPFLQALVLSYPFTPCCFLQLHVPGMNTRLSPAMGGGGGAWRGSGDQRCIVAL